jgi:hypothetical protein
VTARYGCVAQLVEQRSPKPPVGGSNPSALEKTSVLSGIMLECQRDSGQ